MRREAERTLYSLTPSYQKDINDTEYEVIAIDNGSSSPLNPADVTKFGANFKYIYSETDSPSPCRAINEAVNSASGELVMCCIDGARILSPGIIRKTLDISSVYNKPFIYTLAMHLGGKLQNASIDEGYNQNIEDALIKTIDWKQNGYKFFNISCPAGACLGGYFSSLAETNCFTMRKSDYLEMGGYNEKFTSPGGGLCNLDIFNRIHLNPEITPIKLLGEATFHQFHGGVATNVTKSEHPWPKMNDEYKRIYGESYKLQYRQPVYFGDMTEESKRFLLIK